MESSSRVPAGTRIRSSWCGFTPEQFESLLPLIREPYRTMVLVAGCLGLRVSGIAALKCADFDFEALNLLVQRRPRSWSRRQRENRVFSG